MSHQRKFASGKLEGLALASMMGVASLIASVGACSGGDDDTNASTQQGATGAVGAPTVCQTIDIASMLPGSPTEDPDVAAANAFIDATEAAALQQAQNPGALDAYHQEILIGKAEIYDKTLSVNKNLACASCHDPAAGFTGGVSIWNQTVVAYGGSVPITNAVAPAPNARLGPRKPQSYAYAAFAPILHYNATQQSLYGGNFWDMRATGTHLDNPAAEQAEGPPVNPVEMGMPDSACVVYRVSQAKYRALFEAVWGAQSFAITWPANVEKVCSTPAPAPASDPSPVHLSATDRGTSNATYEHITLSMASYEAGPEVSPFSSKFDQFLAGNAQLTAQEQNGWSLFHGKAKCNQCHLDGTATGTPPELTPADVAPLFTDFTANNIGVPNNPCLAFLQESKPDQTGFVANPAGTGFVDLGVGAFLAGNGAAPNPNPTDWGPLAPKFNGMFQTPTLRNVDLRPRPDFVKAYMHNGYFKSLKEVVHFYNTSQALPRCDFGSTGEKTTCWPVPAVPQTLNTTQLGNLGLSSSEEDDIVAFMQTLTDGFNAQPTDAGQPTDASGD